MKTFFIIGALLAAGAGTTWYLTEGSGGGGGDEAAAVPEDGVFLARRGLLNVTITENGSLIAKESRKLTSNQRGRAKITYLIEEGSLVAEGDVLARFDATDAENKRDEVEMELVTAENDVLAARTELEIQEAENVAAIEKAQIALDKARMAEERYEEGDAPKERRDLEVKIKEAQTNFTRAKKTFEDSKILVEQEYINRSQFEEDEIAFERAEVQLEGAKRDLELFEKYTFPMTLTERSVEIKDAERGVETAQKRGESTLRQKQGAVDKSETRLKKLQTQREEVLEELEKMELKAPGPGLVIYGDPKEPWERENIRVGGEVWRSTVVMTIPDLSVMQVKLRIHEADINKLEEGLTAKVSMDTYPGLVLDGEVTRIDTIAKGDNPWEDDPEVKKFTVEVTLAPTDEVELRPGISAKAEIFIDRREDVLYVPIQSVFLEEGIHWVYALDALGKPVAREVTPGQSNDSYIEILDGLEEGQPVLLYNPKLPAGDEPFDADGEPAGGEAEPDGEGAGASGPTVG